MEKTAAAAKWARKAYRGAGVVVALKTPLPMGVADELRGAGLYPQNFYPLEGAVAVLLDGDANAKATLLKAIPEPKSHGSRTEGIMLPK